MGFTDRELVKQIQENPYIPPKDITYYMNFDDEILSMEFRESELKNEPKLLEELS